MTKEAILAMKAGKQLDALVAEQIMGWTRYPERVHPTDSRTIGGVLYCPPGYPGDSGGAINAVPDYSTDIAVAWQVVEHLANIPGTYDDEGRATNGYFGSWFNDACLFALTAKEAACEICKAALIAVAAMERTEGTTQPG